MSNQNVFEEARKKRRRIGCLSILALPFLYYAVYFIFRGPLPANPQLLAHRGDSANYPENTLASFQAAIDVGADWLEMDVQLTKDDVLVVIHDETVDRTTNGTGYIKDFTFEEIRELDAGDGEKIPAFEEVIALAKEGGVNIFPEAKSPELYDDLGIKMVEAVVAADFLDRTIIQSFDADTLDAIHTLNPNAQVCPLYGLWDLSVSSDQPGDANYVCPMGEMILLNPWMLVQAHDAGIQVYPYIGALEYPITERIWLAMGVDGLIVDDPGTLAGVMGR